MVGGSRERVRSCLGIVARAGSHGTSCAAQLEQIVDRNRTPTSRVFYGAHSVQHEHCAPWISLRAYDSLVVRRGLGSCNVLGLFLRIA